MHLDRWQTLMAGLNLPSNDDTFHALVAAYAQPHRQYHTQAHISACLNHLDQFSDYPVHKTELELALWFHDAIYKPFRDDNELQSALWAERFLANNGAPAGLIENTTRLIMATVHNGRCEAPDEQALVDIDLAILGADSSTYQGFEKQVRQEYKWVPSFLYRRKRRELLASFLDRNSIYHSDSFRQRLETQARSNMAEAIKQLS